MAERDKAPDEIESLNREDLDIEKMSPDELDEVSGGVIADEADCGCFGVNCGTYVKPAEEV